MTGLSVLPPIVVFAFNRPEHTRRTLEALARNPGFADAEVHLFCDGPRRPSDERAVAEVRRVLDAVVARDVRRTYAPKNMGLAESVISGVSRVLEQHESVIVVEDDLVTTPDFLEFMSTALETYRTNERVFSVCGFHVPVEIPEAYQYDAYFFPRPGSWGWGTWRGRWNRVDWSMSEFPRFAADWALQARFDRGGDDLSIMLRHQMQGRVDSWAVRFGFAMFQQDAVCLYPTRTRVENIGADGSGRHFDRPTQRFCVRLEPVPGPWRFPTTIEVDRSIEMSLKSFFDVSPARRRSQWLNTLLVRLKILQPGMRAPPLVEHITRLITRQNIAQPAAAHTIHNIKVPIEHQAVSHPGAAASQRPQVVTDRG